MTATDIFESNCLLICNKYKELLQETTDIEKIKEFLHINACKYLLLINRNDYLKDIAKVHFLIALKIKPLKISYVSLFDDIVQNNFSNAIIK